MKDIHIGEKIAEKRKQSGLTQQALAEHVGVSKPAVSKWESGQSCPDIALLPVLAAYFDCSVDELLGYEPQLDREQVRALYVELSAVFADRPFEEGYRQSCALLKKYFSCWSLQFYIALLWINHAELAGSPARSRTMYLDALEVLKRVETHSQDTVLSRQALQLQAFCYLVADQPAKAIALLDDIVEMPIQTEVLLAKAYLAEKEGSKARALLQQYMYENIMGILEACPDLLAAYSDEPDKAEQYYDRILTLGTALGADSMHPSKFISIYMVACQMFVQSGQMDKAAHALERFLDLSCYGCETGWRLRGNELFDCLTPYFESRLLGTVAPRSERFIERMLLAYVEQTDYLAPLLDRPELAQKLERLRRCEEKMK